MNLKILKNLKYSGSLNSFLYIYLYITIFIFKINFKKNLFIKKAYEINIKKNQKIERFFY